MLPLIDNIIINIGVLEENHILAEFQAQTQHTNI